MLMHRDGFVTGISNKKKRYKLYKNRSIIPNKVEFKNEDITYDTMEASMKCYNQDCDAFVRKEQDGKTQFYKKSAYNGDHYLVTPEELETDINNKKLKKDIDNMNKRNKLTSMEIKKSRNITDKLKTERYINQSNKDGLNEFLFFFLISLVVAVLVYHVMRNRKMTTSEFEKLSTIKVPVQKKIKTD